MHRSHEARRFADDVANIVEERSWILHGRVRAEAVKPGEGPARSVGHSSGRAVKAPAVEKRRLKPRAVDGGDSTAFSGYFYTRTESCS